jgi:cellulose synthase (UDP-forming)
MHDDGLHRLPGLLRQSVPLAHFAERVANQLLLHSGAISIPVTVINTDNGDLRLMFDDIPLSRRRELVRVVLARADAWIQEPKPQDNPFRSLLTIVRSVFDLFWLTWKTRRENRRAQAQAQAQAQEDGNA